MNYNFKDLTNEKHFRFTVVKIYGKSKNGGILWLCKCECGNERVLNSGELKGDRRKSCGCYKVDNAGKPNIKHNQAKKCAEYLAWTHMKTRCTNKNYDGFHNYGGRGISVCERWANSFINFYNDMGDKPSKQHSLDRIDVNGNYEPSNCRWATSKEQAGNKTTNNWIYHNGKRMILQDWSRYLNINSSAIVGLLKNGITFSEIYDKNKHKIKSFCYQVDMYKDIGGDGTYQWVTEKRYYNGEKSLNDFDLCDVEGKRKNAKYINDCKKLN